MPVSSYSTARRGISVWIVEDNADFRETIQDLIDSRPDMQCPLVFETAEAVVAALDSTFAPEVILMDIGLPGMSGIEGVRRIKKLSPATEVIMLTIHEDNDTIFNAICAGASGYLLKTASRDDIFDAIAEVLRGGGPMTPQIARRMLTMFARQNTPKADYGLTAREREVLERLVEGKTKQQIADALFVAYHTIDTHTRNIYAKLHVSSRQEAAALAVRDHLIPPSTP